MSPAAMHSPSAAAAAALFLVTCLARSPGAAAVSAALLSAHSAVSSLHPPVGRALPSAAAATGLAVVCTYSSISFNV